MAGNPADGWSTLWPKAFEAKVLIRAIERGRSRPLLISAEDRDGGRTNVVLKLRAPGDTSVPWDLCICRDLVGAICARAIGLPTPDYGLVTVTRAFADSLSGSPEQARVAGNLGLNFGSVLVEPSIDSIPPDAAQWTPILGFDAMLFNGDRKTENPNVLWDGETLYAIDHGLIAPTWEFDSQGYPDETMFGHQRIGDHAAYPYVRKRSVVYANMRHQWPSVIDLPLLDWALAQVPVSWASAAELRRLRDFGLRRMAVAGLQADELEEVLM